MSTLARRKLFWLALLSVWALVVYASVYPGLVSGGPKVRLPALPTALSPSPSWAAIPSATFLLLVAYGIGRKLLARLAISWSHPWHIDLFAAIVGHVPIALGYFVLGLVGAFRLWAMMALLFVLFLWGIRENLALARKLVGTALSAPSKLRQAGPVAVGCAVLIALFGLLGAIAASAPETTSDALFAHLYAVSRFLAAARFTEIPYFETRHVPELAHSLFVPLYALLGDVGPKALVFLQGGLLVLLAGAVAAELANARAGFIAALIVASTPAFLSAATVAFTDVQLALFAASAFYVAVRFGDSPHGALLAGFLAGAAAATKYLGAPLVVVTAALIVWAALSGGFSRESLRAALPRVARALGAAALVAAPFYVKNWITLGNPVYPLFPFLLGSYRFAPHDVNAIIANAGSHGSGRDFTALLLMPWNMTVHGEDFDGCLGALFLAFLPLTAVAFSLRPVRGLLLAAALFLPPFMLGQHTLRWMLTIVPLLAIAIAVALERLGEANGGRIFQFAFIGVTLATAVLHLPFFHEFWLRRWFMYDVRQVPTQVVIGGQSREDYLTTMRPIAPLAKRFAASKRSGDLVLTFPAWDEDAPPLWFDGALVNNIVASHILHEMLRQQDKGGPDAMLAVARRNGITHLLVRSDTKDSRLASLSESSLFGQRYLEPIDHSGPHTIYALTQRTTLPVMLDLVAGFSAARIEPAGAPEPPARLLTFASNDGAPQSTLTVLAHGRAVFPIKTMPKGARFEAELAMRWAVGDGAVAVLSFAEPIRRTELLRQPLSPPSKSNVRGWLKVSIDLAKLAGRSGELVLETQPGLGGDASGDWVGWARPRILAPAGAIERAANSMVAFDLAADFARAEKSESQSGEPSVRELKVDRAGNSQPTITTLAGGFAKYDMRVPDGDPTFEAEIAMPFEPGDGAVAVVRFEEGSETTTLSRVTLAPAPPKETPDPGWTPLAVDLSLIAGKQGKLVISAESGASGDATGDWVSWARARVLGVPGKSRLIVSDLFERFDSATKRSEEGDPPQKLEFERGGIRRRTVVTLSRNELVYAIDLPAASARFDASVAMAHAAGDGAVAVVRFSDGERDRELLRQPLAPAPAEAFQTDPGWTPVTVDLSEFAGRRGELTLTAEPGPAGDATADWIGWADARISAEAHSKSP